MAQALIDAVFQLLIVLVIAGLAYFALRRPEGSFLRFTGLYAIPPRGIVGGFAVAVVAAVIVLLVPAMSEVAMREGARGHQAAQTGSMIGLFVVAAAGGLIQSALTEEILFRGVIGRTLIRRIGFAWGNMIQAVLFGAIHAAIGLVTDVGAGFVIFIVLFSGGFGWANGWANERFGNGSILPGWVAHGTANFTAAVAAALALT